MPLLERHRASGSEHVAAATPASRPGGSLIDPQTLMRIKSLQMRARVAVEGFIKGIHRSPYHGFSVEFSEYREYSPGDDPRYLDWRLYARSDRYYVKRFEDETNLRCYLVLDTSRSMGYRSGAYSKSDYARTAAATIAYFLATPARRGRPAHVRGPDHRVPAAAVPPGPSPPLDGRARARAAGPGDRIWPSRSSRSPRRCASAG